MSKNESLPRRAFLGAALAPDQEAFSEEGVLVVDVVSGGMAMAAGVLAGDTISRLADHPLRSLREMSLALREAGRHEEVELVFVRSGEQITGRAKLVPCPRESIAGQELSYEHLKVDGHRLRTIVTRPRQEPARGAILFLQGIACESVDYGAGTQEPTAQLLHGWAGAGFVTMRVDKRGVGDSEGPCCAEGDFHTELSDHRAALTALQSDPRFAGLEIYLFGHSIGGMVAPMLASQASVAGMMVYGTSTRNWLDCVVASTRRQFELRDMDASEIDSILASLRERVLREGLNGRGAAYHGQLNAIDLPSIWRRVHGTPLLVLCGEHDWVLSRDEQMEIAELVDRAECVELAGLDHMLGWHASRADSLSHYGQGAYRDEILSASLEWLARRGLQSPT